MSLPYKELLKWDSLIDASAGTGKTYSMVELFKTLVREEFWETPEQISGILFLTFTNKAIEELRMRLWNGVLELYERETDKKEKDSWMRILILLPSVRIMTTQQFLHSCIPLLNPYLKPKFSDSDGKSDTFLVLQKARKVFIELLQGKTSFEGWRGLSIEQIQFLVKMGESSGKNGWEYVFERLYRESKRQKGEDFSSLERVLRYQKIYFLGMKNPVVPRFSIPLFDKNTFLENEKKLELALERLEQSDLTQKLTEVIKKHPKTAKEIRDLLQKLKKLPTYHHFYDKALSFLDLKVDHFSIKFGSMSKFQEVDFGLIEQSLKIIQVFRKQIPLYLMLQVAKDMTEIQPENYGFSGELHLVNRLAYSNQKGALQNLPTYTHVFIDEFQDTNVLEWETLKLLFASKAIPPRFFLVGDPKQLIYQFRSSDANAYLKARQEIESRGKIYELVDNYRTAPALLRVLNRIFAAPSFWGDEYHPAVPKISEKEEGVLELLSLDECEKSTQDGILDEVVRYFVQDIINHRSTNSKRSIAILAQKHHYLSAFAKELKAHNIPNLYHKKGELWSSKPAKYLKLFLYALLGSATETDLFLASRTPFFRLSEEIPPSEIFQVLEPQILEYQKILAKKHWSLWRAEVLEHSSLKTQVSESEYEIYVYLLDVVLELLQKEAGDLVRVIDELENRGFYLREFQGDKTPTITDQKEGVVELFTIHTVKGLEFDDVYFFTPPGTGGKKEVNGPAPTLPYVVKILKDGNYDVEFVLGSDPLQEKQEEQNLLTEAKNLFYVALTRAKKRLVIPHHSKNGTDFFSKALSHMLLDVCPDVKIRALGEIPTESSPLTDVNLTSLQKSSNTGGSARFFPLLKNPSWEMISYTSLARENKNFQGDTLRNIPRKMEERPIFLPGGKNTGIFLHTLLEGVDVMLFQHEGNGNAYIRSMMQKYSIGDIAIDILRKILAPKTSLAEKRQLHREYSRNFVLQTFLTANLEILASYEHDWAVDMEMDGLFEREYTRLLDLILETVLPGQEISIKDLFSMVGQKEFTLRFHVPGHKKTQYVESTIDFFFLGAGEKFYFLDWKTDTLASYEASFLREFTLSEYEIQWKLYTLAVVRFLKACLKDFQYEKHFGGFYYFYVRGVYGEGRGVDFHRAPTWEEYLEIEKEVGNWGGYLDE